MRNELPPNRRPTPTACPEPASATPRAGRYVPPVGGDVPPALGITNTSPSQTKEHHPPTRRQIVPPSRPATNSGSECDDATKLFEVWNIAYRRRFGMDYYGDTVEMGVYKLGRLLAVVGELDVCRRMCETFLASEKLAWVENINLDWLCNTSNHQYLLPAMEQPRRKSPPAEWTGSLTAQPSGKVL